MGAPMYGNKRVMVDNPQVFPSRNAAQTTTRRAASSPRNVRACVKNRGRVGVALSADLTGNAVSNSGNVIRATSSDVGPEAEVGAVRLAHPGRRRLKRAVTRSPRPAVRTLHRETGTTLPGSASRGAIRLGVLVLQSDLCLIIPAS